VVNLVKNRRGRKIGGWSGWSAPDLVGDGKSGGQCASVCGSAAAPGWGNEDLEELQ
jgi:hypothetical protein